MQMFLLLSALILADVFKSIRGQKANNPQK